MKPVPVSDADMAFGPSDMSTLMPLMTCIPEDFQDNAANRKWFNLQRDWFYSGIAIEKSKTVMADGIDPELAIRHLGTIQMSFAPKHEHKMRAVAYLASLWFKTVTYNVKQKVVTI